jgi:hypothetical protein
VVACFACWSAIPSATAQQSESPFLMASLSVSPFTAESIRSNISERTNRQELANGEVQPILVSSRKPTDAEAWERFEAEYSPLHKSASPIKRQIESAKYGLDTATFAFDRFVKNVQSQADFSFDQGNLHRTQADSLEGSRSSPRVKLDLNMCQGSKPYVGVQISIPFGR